MGMSITSASGFTQSAGGASAYPRMQWPAGAVAERPGILPLATPVESRPPIPTLGRNWTSAPRFGAAPDLLSPQAAAAKTMNANFNAIKRAMPTLMDRVDEVRSRLSEARKEAQEKTTKKPVQELVFGKSARDIPVPAQLGMKYYQAGVQAASAARNMINDIGEAASAALARATGVPRPEPPSIDIRIGDNTFSLLRKPQTPGIDLRI